MNWLDAVFVIVTLWFMITAFQAGFIRESVIVVFMILGVLLAGFFYEDLAEDVLLFIDNSALARIVAFGVIFGAMALAGQLMALVLKPAVYLLQLGIFDQLAGAGFGILKAAVIIEIFLVVFITYPRWGLDEQIEQSLIGSAIAETVPIVVFILPDEFEAAVEDFADKI